MRPDLDFICDNYVWCWFLRLLCLLACSGILAFGQRKPFTIAEEIKLWLFQNVEQPNPHFSPDGKYFAVYGERGRLDLNRPESLLRFYRSVEVANFVKHSEKSQPPLPFWEIKVSTDKEGPIIPDGSGFYTGFILRSGARKSTRY